MTHSANNPAWTERFHPWAAQVDDYRTPWQVDYSRIIHSESFRRLQGKCQILGVADGDFHRTRLTHSLEVSQIATGILQHIAATNTDPVVANMLPDRTLLETICLIHDLGHPAGSHGGETALSFCMREHGSFEGNGQTIRILTKLEKFSEHGGANLTRRTLLGTLKYTKPYSVMAHYSDEPDPASPITGQVLINLKRYEPPKCYLDTEIKDVAWLYAPFAEREAIIEAGAKSLDCTLMDAADDFSYGVGDVEDAIATGLVTRQQFTEDVPPALWDEFLDRLASRYPDDFASLTTSRFDCFLDMLFGDAAGTKKQVGRLTSYMIANTYVTTREEFNEPMWRYAVAVRPAALALLNKLKRFIMQRVIRAPQVQQLRFKGQQMIIQLFAYLDHDPRHLLPTTVYVLYKAADGDRSAQQRVICDYIAGMTDASLIRAYERLFSPRAGSVFDSLS